jgi:hypothetical protein
MPNASQKRNRSRRPRPLGLFVFWVGRVAAFLLRGCWHTDLGWPVREGDHSYQVCLRCGIKRLFDENAFHGYGPYGYDVNELIARERADRSDFDSDRKAGPPEQSAEWLSDCSPEKISTAAPHLR